MGSVQKTMNIQDCTPCCGAPHAHSGLDHRGTGLLRTQGTAQHAVPGMRPLSLACARFWDSLHLPTPSLLQESRASVSPPVKRGEPSPTQHKGLRGPHSDTEAGVFSAICRATVGPRCRSGGRKAAQGWGGTGRALPGPGLIGQSPM